MFGESINLLSEHALDSATGFYHALDYAEEATIQRLRLGNLMFLHYDREFKKSCKTVHQFAQKFVDRALEFRRRQVLMSTEEQEKSIESGERQKYFFLDELAKSTDNPVMLRDHIVNMLLAAHTTPGLMAFAFYMFGRRKDIWEKARADVLEHYCEPLTYEALMNMKYLRYFIQESEYSI